MWQYETKYQNQNPAENRYQTVKRHTDRTSQGKTQARVMK